MATYQGTEAQTGIQTRSLPYGVVPFESEYVALGTEAAGSVIQMLRPQNGAKILEMMLASDAQAAGVTLAVGDIQSTNRYMTASDVSAAGVHRMDQPAGVGYKVAAPAAWAPSTAYTSGTSFVTANQQLYKCTGTGTSAATGTGPAGTGAAITDGTCTWAYQYPANQSTIDVLTAGGTLALNAKIRLVGLLSMDQ